MQRQNQNKVPQVLGKRNRISMEMTEITRLFLKVSSREAAPAQTEPSCAEVCCCGRKALRCMHTSRGASVRGRVKTAKSGRRWNGPEDVFCGAGPRCGDARHVGFGLGRNSGFGGVCGACVPEIVEVLNETMDVQEHNDWELMQRVAASDEIAIDELYRRFGALVYQSARQVLRSRAETEDAVQEVFVRLWKTADRFDPHRAKLVTWVMLISRRHLIDRLRRQSARPDRAELDTSRTDAGGAIARPEAEGRVEGEEGRERLRRQLARLPELQRSVIERAYLQGFSLREIAEQLNSPLGTVKSALSRGLTRLRELEGAREERG